MVDRRILRLEHFELCKTVQQVGNTADVSSCEMDYEAKRNLDLEMVDSRKLIKDSSSVF
jgi:hypothetical protein